jgi:AcrR family transcriptional regulator
VSPSIKLGALQCNKQIVALKCNTVDVTQSRGAEPDGRTRNGLATRERVFLTAMKVFVARGYDNVTMDEIAAEAGVARRTVFNHFSAKADITVEWAVRRGEQAFALARQRHRRSPDRVRAYFHELAVLTERDWEETRQLATGWLRGYGSPNHRSLLSPELRDWLREWQNDTPGDSQHTINPSLATDALYDVYHGALLRRLAQQAPEPGEFTAEIDAIVALVLAGLAAEVRR